jgi:AcrR family transcriptional regulator
MVAKREYTSAIREQAKSETRERILEAVVRVILEQGIHAFSVQNVAERSGISHRTVYRHFGSREGLLEGLSESLQESQLAAGLQQPTDAGGWAAYVEPLFELFSRSADELRASVIAAVALGYQSDSQRETWAEFQEALVVRYPYLATAALREAAAVFRLLISRYSWYVLSVDLKLDAEGSGRAAAWAVTALLDDLDRRNEAAANVGSVGG